MNMFDGHYFGLTARPFQLTPDPEFWYESATHRKAMAYLSYGLALGEGFIVISGEIGAGKTTLLAHLLATIDRARISPLELQPGILKQDVPIMALARALSGQSIGSAGEAQALLEAQIAQLARMGKRLLVAIDEAQGLSREALEHLRLISNMSVGHQPVIQFLLLGQPELRNVLELPELVQLNQRVIARHHLEGMTGREMRDYVEHRLKRAGWQGTPQIGPGLEGRLFALTDGIPRKVNHLMTRAMLMAALNGADIVTADMVERVATELRAEVNVPAAAAVVQEGAPSVSPQTTSGFSDMQATIADLARRVESQEVALQRVLTLLIDWIDGAEGQRQSHPSGFKEERR